MAYGLMNAANTKKNQALSGLSKSAQDENQRNIANDNIKQAERAQTKTNAGMGASTGALIGAQMAGNAATAGAAGTAAATGAAAGTTAAAGTAAATGAAASGAAAGGAGAAATGIAGLGVGGAALATGGIGLAAGLLLSELF